VTVLHRRFRSDDRPINLPTEAQVLALVQEPDISAELVWPPVIIEDYDVPDFGGSSINPALIRVFIDRSVARRRPTLRRTGLTFEEWRSAVALHEQFENILHRKRGMHYDPAAGPSSHGHASVLEHVFVGLKLQRDPKLYEEDLAEFIVESEAEDIKHPPPDLACFPYYDSPDARDIRILKRLAELGVIDAQHPAQKIDQQAAHYGKGHADGEHCGNCEHWESLRCAVVQDPMTFGDLGWSLLWARK
jgi:hypothetical protein